MNILLQSQKISGRPGAMLGIFSTLFASQGMFLPVKSAMFGIQAQQKILEGMTKPDTDENYDLLTEVGNVLQVNIVDTLNRSENRKETLDAYDQSLHNTTSLLDRKITELTALSKELQKTQRTQQDTVSTLQRSIQKSMQAQDYSGAGAAQEELQKAQSELAGTQTKAKQITDLITRFKALLKIGVQRAQAIEANREVLIAGLKVVNVPGITDLGILQQGAKIKSTGN